MIKISKNELKKALDVVKPGLGSKDVVDQATAFAFIDGRVFTYNDEVSLSHPVESTELSGAVHADELYQLLGKLKKDELEITIEESEMILQCGKSKAGLRFYQEVTMPVGEVGEMGKFKAIPDKLLQFMRFASKASGTDQSKPILTCVHLKKEGVVEASDGYRIVQCTLDAGIPIKDSLLIPSHSVPKIIDINPVKMSEGAGWVHFQSAAGTIISCRVFDDAFPNVAPHMIVEGGELTFPESILELLEKASIFSKSSAAAEERVEVILTEKKVTLKGESDHGWYEESAKVSYSGTPFSFSIFPYIFKDILKESRTAIIGPNKIKFEGEGWEYMSVLITKNK